LNPGITPNGVFWIVQVPDAAVEISGDSLTIHLKNVPIVDQFFFPGGTGNVPATVSFDITYTKKQGTARRVQPTSKDPLSPFTWAGEMWMATNSGSFSMAYNDGSFSAEGTFSSSGSFGEMGTERNGSFVELENDKERNTDADSGGVASDQIHEGQTGAAVAPGNQTSGSENLALTLKSSRARAMRDWKSKP
jgi:hypothetical protein